MNTPNSSNARYTIWFIEAATVATVGKVSDAVVFALDFPESLRSGVSIACIALSGLVVLSIELKVPSIFLSRLYYRWKIVEWTGIVRAFPVKANPNKDDRGEINRNQQKMATTALQKIVETEKDIDILLTSGWYYIGNIKQEGVLYSALSRRVSSPSFKVRVLLLNPDSQQASKRAADLGLSLDSYRQEILASLWTLAQLKKAKGIDIEASLYEIEPVWQMFITKQELWLLCAKKIAADESPIYCIQRTGAYSLAWGMLEVWQQTLHNAKTFDLSKAVEPDWTKVLPRSAA